MHLIIRVYHITVYPFIGVFGAALIWYFIPEQYAEPRNVAIALGAAATGSCFYTVLVKKSFAPGKVLYGWKAIGHFGLIVVGIFVLPWLLTTWFTIYLAAVALCTFIEAFFVGMLTKRIES